MSACTYTERAWAIDLIGFINRKAMACDRAIRAAGGEYGVAAFGKATLFPDVLLYGDLSARSLVLQGWELKFPDTPVRGNEDVLRNALEKCRRLHLESFLVWNGREAVLFRVSEGGWGCEEVRSWACPHVKTREDMGRCRAELERVADAIIDYLNDDFERRPVGRRAENASIGQICEMMAGFVVSFTGPVCDALRGASARSRKWRSAFGLWWNRHRSAHGLPGEKPIDLGCLAGELLVHEQNRFFFVSYLRSCFREAEFPAHFTRETPLSEYEAFFRALTGRRDFHYVFKSHFASCLLPQNAVAALYDFHAALTRSGIGRIRQRDVQAFMQAVREVALRKVAGQYSTPYPLAQFLVELAVDDFAAPVLDPCCGTGTIPRAVLERKVETGMSVPEALRTVFGSDIDASMLQFATLALARADAGGEAIRIFQHNALALKPQERLPLTDARSGREIDEELPAFTCIVTNPPFVRSERWDDEEAVARRALDELARERVEVDAKADYTALVVLSLWRMLAPGGRLGLVLPNAWLSAGWGGAFRAQLQKLFAVESVVTSGCGRWFENDKVVTNLLVLVRRAGHEERPRDEEVTTFAVTQMPLSAWTDEIRSLMAAELAGGDGEAGSLIVHRRLSRREIEKYEGMGLSWSAFFADLSWCEDLLPVTVPVSEVFDVARGERRGWNAFFYPRGADIEAEYLCPVLHSSSSASRLDAEADGVAFSCSDSLDSLARAGKGKALAWIRKFEHGVNGKGVSLPEVLARRGCRWYEMKRTAMADFACSINPDERLFFMRFARKTFVDQRLIRLNLRSRALDKALCHALLNSLACVFYMEALGFGRGEGVLDLSVDRVRTFMRMPDPSRLSERAARGICEAFACLKRREIALRLEDELGRPDRVLFEKRVLEAYGLSRLFERIREAVLALHRIRKAAVMKTEGGS